MTTEAVTLTVWAENWIFSTDSTEGCSDATQTTILRFSRHKFSRCQYNMLKIVMKRTVVWWRKSRNKIVRVYCFDYWINMIETREDLWRLVRHQLWPAVEVIWIGCRGFLLNARAHGGTRKFRVLDEIIITIDFLIQLVLPTFVKLILYFCSINFH